MINIQQWHPEHYNNALGALLLTAFQTGESYVYPQDISAENALKAWSPEGAVVFVALENEQLLGTYTLKPNFPGQGAHVANASFVASPAAAGKGLGKQLGLHALEQAKALGYQAMQFNAVVSTNIRAVKLWERLGFTIIGTVPEGFQHPSEGLVDLFIMHRPLV